MSNKLVFISHKILGGAQEVNFLYIFGLFIIIIFFWPLLVEIFKILGGPWPPWPLPSFAPTYVCVCVCVHACAW